MKGWEDFEILHMFEFFLVGESIFFGKISQQKIQIAHEFGKEILVVFFETHTILGDTREPLLKITLWLLDHSGRSLASKFQNCFYLF